MLGPFKGQNTRLPLGCEQHASVSSDCGEALPRVPSEYARLRDCLCIYLIAHAFWSLSRL